MIVEDVNSQIWNVSLMIDKTTYVRVFAFRLGEVFVYVAVFVDLYDELLSWRKRKEQPANRDHWETLHDKGALSSVASFEEFPDLFRLLSFHSMRSEGERGSYAQKKKLNPACVVRLCFQHHSGVSLSLTLH